MTLNPKIRIVMTNDKLLISRVVSLVAYKMTRHGKPLHEEVQLNTSNWEENKRDKEWV